MLKKEKLKLDKEHWQDFLLLFYYYIGAFIFLFLAIYLPKLFTVSLEVVIIGLFIIEVLFVLGVIIKVILRWIKQYYWNKFSEETGLIYYGRYNF